MSDHGPPHPQINKDSIQRALKHDQAACTEIVEALYPILIGVIRRNLARSESAEDLVQEVLVKIFKSLPSFRAERPFEHWASRIATLTCYDALRRQRRRPKLQYSELGPDECAALSSAFDGSEPAHSDHAASRDLVDQLLATLNPRDQLVIRQLHLEERSIADIAEETGWSVSKVKVTAMRARNKLRKALEHLDPTYHEKEFSAT